MENKPPGVVPCFDGEGGELWSVMFLRKGRKRFVVIKLGSHAAPLYTVAAEDPSITGNAQSGDDRYIGSIGVQGWRRVSTEEDVWGEVVSRGPQSHKIRVDKRPGRGILFLDFLEVNRSPLNSRLDSTLELAKWHLLHQVCQLSTRVSREDDAVVDGCLP